MAPSMLAQLGTSNAALLARAASAPSSTLPDPAALILASHALARVSTVPWRGEDASYEAARVLTQVSPVLVDIVGS